jgi:hypothetical protein
MWEIGFKEPEKNLTIDRKNEVHFTLNNKAGKILQFWEVDFHRGQMAFIIGHNFRDKFKHF